MTLLLLFGGYGTSSQLVTGRQNYAVFDFRDKRVEFEYRKNIYAADFRDKRIEFEYRKNAINPPFRDKRVNYE